MIDTHAHLNFKAYSKDLDIVIKDANQAGVEKIIIPGAKIDSSKKAITIAQQYEACFAAVGIHPHHAKEEVESAEISKKKNLLKNILLQLASEQKVVAIGEIGLDFHTYKDYPPITERQKEQQKTLFLLQLKVAQKANLPVIIHSRKAHSDVIKLLQTFIKSRKTMLKGVFHCFEGTEKQLAEILEMDFFIGFDGNITYSQNKEMQNLVKNTPLNRLLIESDSPYLTPVPFRGKRNTPAYLKYIAGKVSEIKKIPVGKVYKITSDNAKSLFPLN